MSQYLKEMEEPLLLRDGPMITLALTHIDDLKAVVRMEHPSISQLFERSHGAPVIWSGKTIYLTYEFCVEKTFSIEILQSTGGKRVGVQLGSKGKIRINDVSSEKFILWADTAPSMVPVKIVGKSPKTISVSHAWEGPHGTTDFGMGNAAMIVEHSKNNFVFYCNGVGAQTNFDEIVFKLILD